VQGDHNFEEVATGSNHTCAVDTSGHAWCWGYDGKQQLGNGSGNSQQNSPVAVAGTHTFTAITAGTTHTCALDTSGQAWCWGGDVKGQLGDGSPAADQAVPVTVTGTHEFVAISASGEHTCAVDSDRTAWCWGGDTYGELGDDAQLSDQFSPVPVQITEPIVDVTAGLTHTCAVAGDAHVWCWGRDIFGQLGNGSPASDQPTPVAVSGTLEATCLAAGMYHSLALTPDSAGWAWGWDGHGMLGNGDPIANSFVPVAVSGPHLFTSLAAGDYHSCGIDSAGQAWCWGLNLYGQLGDATKEQKTSPVQVAGGLTWKQA
jgi:alpha-tubulin suppressor-like RCC1 family protein